MPQMDAYLVEDDLNDLALACLNNSCVIVPDTKSAEPVVEELFSLDAFRKRRETGESLFFVLSKEWEQAPLEFRTFQRNGRTLYFILQKTGGPSIDIYAPPVFEREGRRLIPAGFIGYHSRFWNQRTQRMEKPPEPLVSFYKRLCLHLRSGSKLMRSSSRTFRISRNTQRALEAGAVLVPPH